MKYYHEKALVRAIDGDEFYYTKFSTIKQELEFILVGYTQYCLKRKIIAYPLYIKLPNSEYYEVSVGMVSYYIKKSHKLKSLYMYENR